MKMVFCLDTGEKFYYGDNKTPYEALSGMLYTLNLSHNDPKAKIDKTESGLHLYFDHCGKTYAIRNN